MSIISKSINKRDDWMYLRISADAEYLLIYQHLLYSRDWLSVYRANDEFRFPNTIPRRKEAWSEHYLTTIFDISPNGRYVALCYDESPSSAADGMGCYIWDTEQKVSLPPFIHQEMVNKSFTSVWRRGTSGYNYLEIRFLPDSECLITVTTMGEIFVWHIPNQKLLWSVSAAATRTISVAFTNKLGYFVMSERIDTFYGAGMISNLPIRWGRIHYLRKRSPLDARWIVDSNWVSEPLKEADFLRLWNIYSGELIREFEADSPVTDLVFSHDDKLIAGTMNNTSLIWDVNTGEVMNALPENTKSIGFTANDSYLIVIHEGNTIALWDIQAKQWEQRFELGGPISSAQVSQSDKVVVLSKTIDDWQLHQIQV